MSTPTGLGTGVTSNDSLGEWVNYPTTTSGTIAGVQGATVLTSLQAFPRSVTAVQFPAASDITNTRIWIAFTATAATLEGQDVPTVQTFGVRYAPATDGTAFFRLVSYDGTTVNTQTTTVAVTNGITYTIGFDGSSGTSVDVWINGVKAGTMSANLPAAATSLVPVASTTSSSATVENIKIKGFNGSNGCILFLLAGRRRRKGLKHVDREVA